MNPTAILGPLRPLLGALAASLLCLGSAFAGEGSRWDRAGGASVAGSGHAASERRSVAPFKAVALTGSMTLVLRQAAREAVEVRADGNLLPLIETTVVERKGVPTLEIGARRGASFSTRQPIVVSVDVVELKALSLSGSGDAVAQGLKVGELQVRIAGSGDLRLQQLSADSLVLKVAGGGDVTASGRTGTLGISIAGSGDVAARELEAEEVSVSIAGSGDASVNARATLRVAIAGSGDVAYSGNPTVKTSIVGSGDVKKQ
ncbi:MAG TPA: head GIN domain-containing protein [Albitalea sp.]